MAELKRCMNSALRWSSRFGVKCPILTAQSYAPAIHGIRRQSAAQTMLCYPTLGSLTLREHARRKLRFRAVENPDEAHGRAPRPIDPKLSDGGGWRDGCAGEGGGAASVTAGAVRCSAGLGIAAVVIWGSWRA